MRSVYQILVLNLEVRKALGRSRSRWEVNIRMNLWGNRA